MRSASCSAGRRSALSGALLSGMSGPRCALCRGCLPARLLLPPLPLLLLLLRLLAASLLRCEPGPAGGKLFGASRGPGRRGGERRCPFCCRTWANFPPRSAGRGGSGARLPRRERTRTWTRRAGAGREALPQKYCSSPLFLQKGCAGKGGLSSLFPRDRSRWGHGAVFPRGWLR